MYNRCQSKYSNAWYQSKLPCNHATINIVGLCTTIIALPLLCSSSVGQVIILIIMITYMIIQCMIVGTNYPVIFKCCCVFLKWMSGLCIQGVRMNSLMYYRPTIVIIYVFYPSPVSMGTVTVKIDTHDWSVHGKAYITSLQRPPSPAAAVNYSQKLALPFQIIISPKYKEYIILFAKYAVYHNVSKTL